MKWKANIPPDPQVGDYRIRKFFAWLPVTVAGQRVWLERYMILEEYRIAIRTVFVGKRYFGRIKCGGWDKVNEKICEKVKA